MVFFHFYGFCLDAWHKVCLYSLLCTHAHVTVLEEYKIQLKKSFFFKENQCSLLFFMTVNTCPESALFYINRRIDINRCNAELWPLALCHFLPSIDHLLFVVATLLLLTKPLCPSPRLRSADAGHGSVPLNPRGMAPERGGLTKNSLKGEMLGEDSFSGKGQWAFSSIWLSLSSSNLHKKRSCVDNAIWGKASEDASLLINCW